MPAHSLPSGAPRGATAQPAEHRGTAIGPLSSLALLLACALPPLLAYNLTPSATLFNQLAALGGWGLLLLALRFEGGSEWLSSQGGPAVQALLLLLAAPLLSWVWAGLPFSLVLTSVCMLAAALLVLRVGLGLDDSSRAAWFAWLSWGLLAAGLLSLAVSLVQVFAPQWADGQWIARSGVPGRAVGNMRQPNHLASLLMWACVAAVYLGDRGHLGRWRNLRLERLLLPLLLFAFVFAVVLSASRTGMGGVLILALWGALDRRLGRVSKLSLLATPLMLGLSWWLMMVWASDGAHAFGAASRLNEGAGSPSRLAVLANAWSLLKENPWTGVGWGEFNFAWSMSVFPQRPVAFFDHTHNLPMQLAVELGLPASLLILTLLGLALWRALRLSLRGSGETDELLSRRCGFMLVLMIGVHSLLEYPLWYAYFLLPAAFALGLATGRSAPSYTGQRANRPSRPLRWVGSLGGLMLAASLFAVWDYLRVVAIYAPGIGAAPLPQRIEDGQRSLFFATQADYAAATSPPPGPATLAATRATAHNLIDARLMMAWAKALHASGETEAARHVVERLREFHSSTAEEWLAECDLPELKSKAQAETRPFQCQPPERPVDWRALR